MIESGDHAPDKQQAGLGLQISKFLEDLELK